jgi:DNA-binding NarL/FixJ family response regulator
MEENATRPDVQVLVVDDQRLMRDGIASLLSIQAGIKVVGMATNGREAVEQARALQPDVILMDLRMPIMDGVTATTLILAQRPNSKVLMLTTFDDEESIVDALRAGASGYLLKDMPAQDLAKAIYAAHAGIYQLNPSVASKVVASLTGVLSALTPAQPQPDPLQTSSSELTSREIEVLRLIAQGTTNREIATRLTISEGTVKNHISSILNRLGLRDRTQAAIYAREHGLLS